MDDQQSKVLDAIQNGGLESWSVQMVGQIFGPLAGGGGTLFSTAIGYYNLAILVVGGLLFFYNVTAGTLQTAHEGVVLGKRGSSLWAPIRIIFALGLMMPVPNLGGYSTSQAGIAWLVRGSTALASLMWSSSVPLLLDGQVQIAASVPAIPTTFVSEIWKLSACLSLANYQLEAAGSHLRVSIEKTSRPNGQIAFVTSIAGRPDSAAVCGAVATPSVPVYLLTAATSETSAAAASDFESAHEAALTLLLDATAGLADQVLASSLSRSGPLPAIAPDLRAAVIAANGALQPIGALVSAVSSDGGEGQQRLRDYIENDQGQGWLAAGSYYLVLARLNSEVASVISATPSVLSPARYVYETTGTTLDAVASGRWTGIFGNANAQNLALDQEEIARVGGDMERAFARASASLSALGFALPDPALAAALAPANGEGGGIWDVIGAAVDGLGRQLAQNVALYFAPDHLSTDPMTGLVALGQFLVAAAAALVAALAIASALPVVGAAVAVATSIIGPLILALTVIGATMSVLLPSMPFVLWILALFGYFVTVAIIAAPLWALAHLKMDGEGIAPAGARQGYVMLLRLFLNPPLMILGFFAAMTIFRVVSALIGTGIYYLLSSFSGLPLHWLVSVVVMTALTVALFLMVIERSFALITALPNAVLAWLGASTHDDN